MKAQEIPPSAGSRPPRSRSAGDLGNAPSPAIRWPVAIGGVPFDNVTLEDAVALICAMIADGRPHYVATANMDFVVQSRADVELRRILLEADLVLCDGKPLVWASRLLGNPLLQRVAGADLVPSLVRESARLGHRVFLLGAGAGVAEIAAERLQRAHPSLIIAGHYSPPFRALLEMDHGETAERIRAARPDLLLVSFGCPKQEKWIAMHYRALGVPVVIGVGASLDFLADRVKRAPVWMQRGGMEWSFRLLQEPRRLFARYANDLARFAPALAAQSLNLSPRYFPSRRLAEHEAVFFGSNWMRIEAPATLTQATIRKEARHWAELGRQARHCFLDAKHIRALDSTGAALIARWHQRLHAQGFRLVLLSPSNEVLRVLDHMGWSGHLVHARTWAEAQRLVLDAATPRGRVVSFSGGQPRPFAWRGEVTAENVELVWEQTIALLRSLGSRRVTLHIDVSDVPFVDSSGVGLMLRVSQWARQRDLEIRFTRPTANVLNVLRLTRLDHLLVQSAA